MTNFRVRSKTWLEVNGKPFLGDGRLRLLLAVQRNGSINAAARDLGISYRKAWAQLQALEEISPMPLLERRTGGRGGGETRLTAQAVELIERFDMLRQQVNQQADRLYKECFSEEGSDFDA
ncbi:MAG: winged helix-turn-helix domain-containing protein [Desulfuromonadales bacterium]